MSSISLITFEKVMELLPTEAPLTVNIRLSADSRMHAKTRKCPQVGETSQTVTLEKIATSPQSLKCTCLREEQINNTQLTITDIHHHGRRILELTENTPIAHIYDLTTAATNILELEKTLEKETLPLTLGWEQTIEQLAKTRKETIKNSFLKLETLYLQSQAKELFPSWHLNTYVHPEAYQEHQALTTKHINTLLANPHKVLFHDPWRATRHNHLFYRHENTNLLILPPVIAATHVKLRPGALTVEQTPTPETLEILNTLLEDGHKMEKAYQMATSL